MSRPPRRVAVTSPQTRLARARGGGGPRRDRPWRKPQLSPAEAEHANFLYRRQRALAGPALAALVGLLFGLPVLFALVPALDTVRVAGIPASWLVLAVLPYPALLALARWQLRRAERVEDEADRLALAGTEAAGERDRGRYRTQDRRRVR